MNDEEATKVADRTIIRRIRRKKPKKNCRRCYGRGLIGFDIDRHVFIPCSCAIEVIKTNGE